MLPWQRLENFSERIQERGKNLRFGILPSLELALSMPCFGFATSLILPPSFGIEFFVKTSALIDKTEVVSFKLADQKEIGPGIVACIDLFCQLAQDRSRRQLTELTWREIESYFRDSNLVPSVPSDFPFGQPQIAMIIDDLIHAWELKIASQTGELGKNTNQRPWSELDLLEKIALTQDIIACKIRPFLTKDGGDLSLIDVDDDEVLVEFQGTCRPCPANRGGTLRVVAEILRDNCGVPEMKVVAQK